MHVALPKRPINYLKLDQQSRQQALRAFCPNIYTVLLLKAIAERRMCHKTRQSKDFQESCFIVASNVSSQSAGSN